MYMSQLIYLQIFLHVMRMYLTMITHAMQG